MALFGDRRDASFVRGITREVMRSIIDVEVELYKIILEQSPSNIYGETINKTYYDPFRLHCLVRKDDTTTNTTDVGLSFDKTITFAFLRDDLVNLELQIEVGDLVGFDNGYYEVDNVRMESYWFGRNPETLIGNVQGELPDTGYNVSVVVESHRIAESAFNLKNVRFGAPPEFINKGAK